MARSPVLSARSASSPLARGGGSTEINIQSDAMFYVDLTDTTGDDEAGSNNMTVVASPGTTTGPGGTGTTAIEWVRGDNQYMTRATSTIGSSHWDSNDTTLVCWVYMGLADPSAYLQLATIMGLKFENASPTGNGMHFVAKSASSGDIKVPIVADWSMSTWYMLAGGTLLGSNQVWGSLNGGTKSYATLTGGILTGASGTSIDIGRSAGQTPNWGGRQAYAGVFDRQLSDAELLHLYNSGSGRAYADL